MTPPVCVTRLTFHSKISSLPDLDVILLQFCLAIPRLDSDFMPEASYGVVETTSNALKIKVSFKNWFCISIAILVCVSFSLPQLSVPRPFSLAATISSLFVTSRPSSVAVTLVCRRISRIKTSSSISCKFYVARTALYLLYTMMPFSKRDSPE